MRLRWRGIGVCVLSSDDNCTVPTDTIEDPEVIEFARLRIAARRAGQLFDLFRGEQIPHLAAVPHREMAFRLVE